jgi:hypothetical protein
LDLQLWHLPGIHRRRFHVGGGRSRTSSFGTSRGPTVDVFTLVVDARGPPAPAPPAGPPSTFSHWCWALEDLQLRHLPRARHRCFHVGGGRSRTFSSGTSRRPAVDVFTLVVGAPELQLQHLPGARRRCFDVGGGRSRSSSSGTSEGSTVDVFVLVVGAPGAPAPTPPGGPPSTFSCWWWALSDLQLRHLPGARCRHFHVGGGRSWTFTSGTSWGLAVDVFTLVLGAPGPSAPATPEGPLSMFSRCWWALPDL